ncbi:splicing factor 3B subunit 2 [Anastrepha ludens]|uniref:splicing factor 3B subunit 2 n=1 Tax=Anastrepha ludens TaxID=28586 RepID=UPI0023B11CE1|nr:splicing factor 3B subunit 2 [Anastrepha ludens]
MGDQPPQMSMPPGPMSGGPPPLLGMRPPPGLLPGPPVPPMFPPGLNINPHQQMPPPPQQMQPPPQQLPPPPQQMNPQQMAPQQMNPQQMAPQQMNPQQMPPLTTMPPQRLPPPHQQIPPPHQQIPPPQQWNHGPPPPRVEVPNVDQVSRPMPLMSMPVEKPIPGNDSNGTGTSASADGAGDGAVSGENSDSEDKNKKPAEVVLPKALEDVLALKDQRAAEFHINAEDFTSNDMNNVGIEAVGGGVIGTDYGDAGEDSDDEGDSQMNGSLAAKGVKQSRAEKNKKKKRRKKQNRKLRQQREQERTNGTGGDMENEPPTGGDSKADDEDINDESNKAAKSSDDEEEEKHAKDKQKGKNKTSKESKSKKNKSKDKEKEKKIEKENSADSKGKSLEAVEEDVTIEYVPERITIADLAPMYRQFYRVFEIFKLENKPKAVEKDKKATETEGAAVQKKPIDKMQDDDDDDENEETKEDKEKLSKRKLKKLTRLSVAELKQLVSRPDVVEMHDVTARDPKLLVQLKAYRNTVQVPRHWCFKRKYLQGKRGIEKPPFDLPAFIKKTGIMEMRESLQEKDDAKSLKSKMRERVRPKMGKIDIDYQKLHDAFFKWQTKPRMTIHGDLYYEGKEYETRLKEKKPGDLSEELRIALGMPVGPNSHKIPPPWLIAQQRYGPPPSYPNLKIPGLNAPIPEGTSFGYHAGGWGKPPVDENGKPLYGDVFGTNIMDLDSGIDEGDIERNQWGELESESEESSEEEEEDGEDLGNQPDDSGLVTPAEGLVTPSGLTSVPAGMETPETIELRKKKIEAEMEDNDTPVLYQVLPEKRTDRVGASMMGSTHVYDISGVSKPAARAAVTVDREGTVELALDPSELDLDNEAMAQRYEQQMREQQSHLQKEDLSDMLAEHVARQKSKRKRQQADTTSKTTKKYKEFKF